MCGPADQSCCLKIYEINNLYIWYTSTHTLIAQEIAGERRHAHEEVQHRARVRIVRAVVIRLKYQGAHVRVSTIDVLQKEKCYILTE